MLKITKITPVFNKLITTMDKYENDVYENGVITHTKGELKDYQTVIAVGSSVRVCNPGDKIMIDFFRYKVSHGDEMKENLVTQKITYQLNTEIVNGEPVLVLYDNDIKFVFEGEEVEDEAPKKNAFIIDESKPSLILQC